MKKKIFNVLLSFVVLLLIGLQFFYFADDLTKYLNFNEIETTEGTVLPHTKSSYIAYEYEVNGIKYVSSRVFWFDRFIYNKQSGRVKKSYPSESNVKVFYNINSPAESVLENDFNDWSTVVFSFVFVSVFSFWCIYNLKNL